MNIFCHLKSILRPITIFLLTTSVATCTRLEPTPPVIATLTTASDYERQFNEYLAQVDTRQNEISVVIEPTKLEYEPNELIEFEVTITNLSDRTIVIRRPEAELNYLVFPTPMEFVLIPSDSNIRINLLLPPGSIDARIEIQPDEFVVLETRKSYVGIVPIIPRPNQPLPAGKYSVNGKYQNYTFGAFINDEETLITDYNAWMGEIETNSTTFEVVP